VESGVRELMEEEWMKLLRGAAAATLTPFKKDGSVDYKRIPGFARFLIDRGITGFWVCGTSGEVPTLMKDERKRVLEAFVNEAAGQIPVVAHIGHPSTAVAVDLAGHAADAGADAVACCAPFPMAPTEEGLLGHWRAVSAATELPFFMYVIPWLAPVEFSAQRIDRLRRKLRAPGIKYSVADVQTLSTVRRLAGKRFNIVSGIDDVLVPFALSCVDGTVGLGHNSIPEIFVAMHRLCDEGKIGEAKALQDAYNDFSGATPEGVSIFARTKLTLKLRGMDIGETRRPMCFPRGAARRAIERAWKRLVESPVVAKCMM